MFKGYYIKSYLFSRTIWFTGYMTFIISGLISFLGYCLTWGQVSLWAGIVIINIFEVLPDAVDLLIGHTMFGSVSISRFYISHSLLSLYNCILICLHFINLHLLYSTNTLNIVSIFIVTFYPIILFKDFY